MGRLLGSLADEAELDRPDLNKCPDCGCFFASDNCPLCKKPCPENMRAGKRKAEKKKRSRSGGAGRVTFVEWYHSWWFIILMTFIFPIVSIVLLITSPHKKWKKVVFIAVAVAYILLSSVGIGNIVNNIMGLWDRPVDTSLTKSEYISACRSVSAEQLYRSPESYKDEFVCVTLKVVCRAVYAEDTSSDDTYYICTSADGSDITVIVRDCLLTDSQNFIAGDIITLYGEGAGEVTAYNNEYFSYTGPCVNMAYVNIE